VRRDRQGLADIVQLVTSHAVEAVDRDDERDGAALEVVDCREALVETLRVDQDDATDGTADQVVPHEEEAVLAGCPEQVQPQGTGERDATEVHGDRRGRLAVGHSTSVVDADGVLRHGGFGVERLDVGDRADEGRLADGEAACDDDLDNGGGNASAGDCTTGNCGVRGRICH
jgi:hypothetical protein